MRQASETFNTDVMKTEEVILFCAAAVDNGATVEEAYADMKCIDAILRMKQLHRAVYCFVKKTQAGHFRKGVGYYDSLEKILEARSQGAFD